jgi:molybdate transport system ATP-binding protein
MITVDIFKKLNNYGEGRHISVTKEFSTASITKIHGPSGVGKTTLLKIIAGLMQPDKGKIIAGEKIWLDTVENINVPPQIRKAGFVFQHFALFPNMTVRQHLEYATSDKEWINKLLAISGLQFHSDQKPNHLSGGQQQRLAIIRALANKPELLLMDEPFSALDPKMKAALLKDLQQIWSDLGTTVLIVSHNPLELSGIDHGELYLDAND